MKKLLQKRLKNEKGLTLVELLAVIVILGIIAAIAVPAIGGVIENSKYNAVKADALNALNAANLYFIDGKADSVTIDTLVSEGYLENRGKLPTGNTNKVEKGTPSKITTAEIDYSGGKKVTFSGATVESINNDPKKGSGAGGYTITGTTTNP
ncbi:prepilin-type N-terminal cleavage/methylation domain-containing protein [Saccharococcus sp. Marseille-Q5394]|uniref:prepilin-type N-terminal cleavage/methylation domain-containing protein n=1 Tax=Saccharococcus sp. Marseille-Q5394 TaxID=2972778 RepID=UPI0021C8DD96|nr:prepilin-type N-terminal cleavage/methylation domain-containing protein [Saccharococcus sp. Marseille-Q5394]